MSNQPQQPSFTFKPPPQASAIQPQTVEEARKLIEIYRREGITCPVCRQFAKEYHRKFLAGMAHALILLYRATVETAPIGGWIHSVELITKLGNRATLVAEVPKLAYWGLVEAKPNETDKTKRDSGFYRVTEKGRDFVLNRTSLPSHVWVYNGEVLSLDHSKLITVAEALGNQFDYSELMAAPLEAR